MSYIRLLDISSQFRKEQIGNKTVSHKVFQSHCATSSITRKEMRNEKDLHHPSSSSPPGTVRLSGSSHRGWELQSHAHWLRRGPGDLVPGGRRVPGQVDQQWHGHRIHAHLLR